MYYHVLLDRCCRRRGCRRGVRDLLAQEATKILTVENENAFLNVVDVLVGIGRCER